MIPFEATDWEKIPLTKHTGETGYATWQTMQYELLRVRLVRYSANYKADHWCEKGHITYCIEGEFTSHLKDGRLHKLKKECLTRYLMMKTTLTFLPLIKVVLYL